MRTQNLSALSATHTSVVATPNTRLTLVASPHSPPPTSPPIPLPQPRKSTYAQLVIVLSPLAAIWPVIQGSIQGSGTISVPSLAVRRDVPDKTIYSSSKSCSPSPSPFLFFVLFPNSLPDISGILL